MADLKHIEHIGDSQANGRSNLDILQLMIESSESLGSRFMTYDDAAGNYHTLATQHYWDGSLHYMDADFNDITAQGDFLASEYIRHDGDTDTRIRFQDDQITFTAGGADAIDIVEGATDYVEFKFDIFADDGIQIKLGNTVAAPDVTFELNTDSGDSFQIRSSAGFDVVVDSGDITLQNDCSDILIDATAGSTTVHAYNSLDLKCDSGDVDIEAVGGSTTIRGDNWKDLTDWSSSLNAVGFSGTPTEWCNYVLSGDMCHVWFLVSGTSNSTALTFTLPKAQDLSGGRNLESLVFTKDNGGNWSVGQAFVADDSSNCQVFKDLNLGTFTNSGTKGVKGELHYHYTL